jgi:predicted dehydrogenase
MRFALFCDDPLARPVVDALSEQVDGHQLTHAVRVSPKADELLHGRSRISFVEHWENLLVDKTIDAVLVGGSDPQILEGAKQLATAGIPMLFVPQAAQGSTFVYELSLIRDDNRVSLYPLLRHRFDAAVRRLQGALKAQELGRVQFLQLERVVSREAEGMPVSQSEVDAELLRDVDLLRWLMGDYNQITGLRTAATSDGVQMQSVVLAGRSLPEANWSIRPAIGTSRWHLTVRGEKGVAELDRDGALTDWVCHLGGERVAGDERSTSRGILHAFASATAHAQRDDTPEHGVNREWGELVKCFETVDATHRSVARRRTIDLHFEPMSERAIFKTQMTAIGCGLLVGTFLLTLCYLGIASLVPLPGPILIGMRTIVFAPLVLFLFAQILLPLTRPSSNEQTVSP